MKKCGLCTNNYGNTFGRQFEIQENIHGELRLLYQKRLRSISVFFQSLRAFGGLGDEGDLHNIYQSLSYRLVAIHPPVMMAFKEFSSVPAHWSKSVTVVIRNSFSSGVWRRKTKFGCYSFHPRILIKNRLTWPSGNSNPIKKLSGSQSYTRLQQTGHLLNCFNNSADGDPSHTHPGHSL